MITDHEFVNFAPEGAPDDWPCAFVYMPDNPEYEDPSVWKPGQKIGWMLGGPVECGGTKEQHT